jgi:hypothetical protein
MHRLPYRIYCEDPTVAGHALLTDDQVLGAVNAFKEDLQRQLQQADSGAAITSDPFVKEQKRVVIPITVTSALEPAKVDAGVATCAAQHGLSHLILARG